MSDRGSEALPSGVERLPMRAGVRGMLPFSKRDKASSAADRKALATSSTVNARSHQSRVESIPEEILLHPSNARRDSVVRTSNQVADGKSLLTDDQLEDLRRSLTTIHREFRTLYGKKSNDQFAMEIEWQITQDGKLAIKQARPWVY